MHREDLDNHVADDSSYDEYAGFEVEPETDPDEQYDRMRQAELDGLRDIGRALDPKSWWESK